jgi:hypothetical protein
MLHIRDCYHLLRIQPGASLDEIKQAFRARAKQLHPDRNIETDAHEQFIRLHEAYEMLCRRVMTDVEEPESGYEKHMERARRSAAAYARMKYEQYERETEMYHNSPYAWIFKILYYGLFLVYLFCAMLFAILPLGLLTVGVKWFFISCPLWVLSYISFVGAYQWKKEIDPLF